MIKFDDAMKTLTDPGELSTYKKLKQAAALLQHYHDALVREMESSRDPYTRDNLMEALEGVSDV
jgi:hypothetical protein